MTKLEQKLIELGYKYKEDIYYKYFYSNDNFLIAFIMIIVNEYKVCDYKTVVAPPYAFVKVLFKGPSKLNNVRRAVTIRY